MSTQHTNPETRRRRKKKRGIILLSILAVLIGFRLVLPYIVLRYVNHTLSTIEQYQGHVEDIDLALIRGAYIIKGIRIDKKDAQTGKADTVPFFTARELDLSVEWRAIFKGSIVGEITVESPVLNFVKDKHQGEDVQQDTADFRDVVRDLMPLTINRFDIHNGQIHFVDPTRQPRIDVALTDLNVHASNLSNVNDSQKPLPARIAAKGKAYAGVFSLDLDLDLLQEQPAFDLNAGISNVDMVQLNPFFKAYGQFDVRRGTFGLYSEFAAKNGNFKGYVKPILKDLDIVQLNREEGNPAQILWESVIGGVAEIFQNQRKEQFATKLPIEGKFEKPDIGLWNAVVYVLKNAFVNALKPSVDNSIDLGQVADTEKQGMFGKLFGKDKK